MKLIYFAPYDCWESHGSPQRIGGADVLFIDPDRYRRDKSRQQPVDNENFVTYNLRDLKEGHSGLTDRRPYEDFLLMADKVLDKIDDGEDLILLTEKLFLFRYEEEIQFFRCLKRQKSFKLHLIIAVSVQFSGNDYHQLLRLFDVNDICESICFINTNECDYNDDSLSLDLFNNEKTFEKICHTVEALPLRNKDRFCIYDHQKLAYVPCKRTDYTGDDMLEFKTPNGDICDMMFRYRKIFAEKHGLNFDYNPCTNCECKNECTDVCKACDYIAKRLWEKVCDVQNFEYEDLSAKINGIDRFRIGTDGIGVRSLILMAGCPLNCAYCGNKRYKDIFPETSECEVSVMEYYLHKDGIYFEMTDGGVTFGGGEPLMQAEFIHEFHRKYPMWSVNIETSLNVPADKLRIIADDVDYWFVDIKDMNPDIYQRYTGKSNVQVRENLAELLKLVPVQKICVRVPLITGYNTSEDVERSAAELTQMGFTTIERFEYVVC